MPSMNSSSIARILAAPLQQQRNLGRWWSAAIIVALCVVPSPVLFALWGGDAGANGLRLAAARAGLAGFCALVLIGWVMVAGNILRQNRPELARLVPAHVARLRTALLVAWTMLVLVAAAIPGVVFGAQLAWACTAAAVLALIACVLRWPALLLLCGPLMPFAVNATLMRRLFAEHQQVLSALWVADDWIVTASTLAAGALLLVLVVQPEGRRNQAARGAGRAVGRCLRHFGWRRGRASAGPAAASYRLTATRLPYDWWLQRLLARRDSPVTSRLLAGFGRSAHWTTRVFELSWMLVASGCLCAVAIELLGVESRGLILAWSGFSIAISVGMSALQGAVRLRETRREQALLALLPGVPRGARLNRWLGWQMSAESLCCIAVGLLLFCGIDALAEWLSPGVVQGALGGINLAAATVMLPQLAWQWRQWARMPVSAAFDQGAPALVQVALAAAVLGLHALAGFDYLAIGTVLAATTLLYCAWRWRRMDDEPTALPVARLA